jgi:hypothetical protein
LLPIFTPLPSEIMLSAYPNPFNSAIEISTEPFSRLLIYNLKGNIVENVVLSESGFYLWQPPDNLPSGIYLVTSEHNHNRKTLKTVYLK